MKHLFAGLFGRRTMRIRLIAFYVAGIVLPLMIFGMIFIRGSGQIVEDQLIAMAGTSLSQIAERLNGMLRSYMTLTDQYLYDVVFMQALRKDYPSVMDAYELYTEIWAKRKSFLLAWPDIRNITIYTENESLVTTTPFIIRAEDYFSRMPASNAIYAEKYRGVWYGVRRVGWQYEYWNPKNEGAEGSPLSTFTYNRNLQTGDSLWGAKGIITVEIYDTAITKVIQNGMDAMEFSIVDAHGDTMYANDAPKWPREVVLATSRKTPNRIEYQGESFLLWCTELANGWALLSAVSLDIVTEQARKLRMVGELVLLMMALFALYVIWMASGRLTRDVRMLADKMHRIDSQTPVLEPVVSGSEEIYELDKAFSAMIERLHDSVLTQYGAEVRRKEAELELLHTQISPHFLYNMLSTIAWLADSRPAAEVRMAIEWLARYYRLTLAKGREVIPLQEELDGLSAYIELQRLRFGNRVRYMMDVDDMLMGTIIPRMTLQPLVENCIIHGPGDERRPISILISARLCDDSLLLIVEDDGVGMDSERLAQLAHGLPASSGGSGLGYQNVAERISMHFGDEYGIKVSSAIGDGTTVEIRLPLPDIEGDGK